ncbi:hypothetical protein AK812_SmicGene12037 [Symbiodinium microadriaticum]|uniref:Uncharacterized protein n=1 Tax=Symbiodinium microadriaticum TaxID=2951 RepID=A0A1Q9EBG6_SYMMI|nr:hypothetical protein AK812_SmicGene12037 [Symbiodinium microadriaticum]CAE7250870.1 unnamed protein product [Symbiodinium microadriaticum]CAE7945993.1 unnamed protein product [Symbiodinium sp. KB8]
MYCAVGHVQAASFAGFANLPASQRSKSLGKVLLGWYQPRKSARPSVWTWSLSVMTVLIGEMTSRLLEMPRGAKMLGSTIPTSFAGGSPTGGPSGTSVQMPPVMPLPPPPSAAAAQWAQHAYTASTQAAAAKAAAAKAAEVAAAQAAAAQVLQGCPAATQLDPDSPAAGRSLLRVGSGRSPKAASPASTAAASWDPYQVQTRSPVKQVLMVDGVFEGVPRRFENQLCLDKCGSEECDLQAGLQYFQNVKRSPNKSEDEAQHKFKPASRDVYVSGLLSAAATQAQVAQVSAQQAAAAQVAQSLGYNVAPVGVPTAAAYGDLPSAAPPYGLSSPNPMPTTLSSVHPLWILPAALAASCFEGARPGSKPSPGEFLSSVPADFLSSESSKTCFRQEQFSSSDETDPAM